ncbi:hypothetical protein H072_3796 [Dactylellina haptotyla CBS 200.50]|uniref:ARS-binding protein 1 N-terminal domain-containing protein n=1 Tax=Dactylellina haptotyla (strain CBS 200.50) TaxID=1284197 RepID=S8AH90_DACHA|nr:hypothetical protein H072_3796 [Dactylellina haptotyla CBS 200.50]
MAASFSGSLGPEGTESPSAQLMGEGSPTQGSESAAGDSSTMDPNLSPSKRKGGRQPVDNSDETKERHGELYKYYKQNPGMSQAKMAEWYTTKFGSTMSQCTVSQVLKKQKLLHGEEIAEPRPRKSRPLFKPVENSRDFTTPPTSALGARKVTMLTSPHVTGKRKSIKAEDLAGESKPKKQRGDADGTPIVETVVYTPNSQFNNPPSFQAVNAPNHSASYSSFQSPATPVSLAHAALSHTESITPTSGSVPFRATDPSRTNQQPFTTGPHSRPVQPIIHHPGSSTPTKTLVNGSSTSPIGGVMLDQSPHPRSENLQSLQSELESSRRTVSEYQKIVQKQETLIDNILTNQQSEKEKIRALEVENSMLRERKGNEQISELLTKIEKLTRDLENEKERNRSMVELWGKEEQQLKDLLATRSNKFPLGADIK